VALQVARRAVEVLRRAAPRAAVRVVANNSNE
jgi:hypothetical protein